MTSYTEFRKKALKKEERLFSKYIIRPLSTRLSWSLLKIYPEVKPNQVTALAFCIGLIGISLLFFARSSFEVIIASSILYVWTVFDSIDGEIARFKDMKTPTGFFLEIIFDHFIAAMIPVGISLCLYRCSLQTNVLFLGLVESIFILFYIFVIATYYWTSFEFIPQLSSIEVKLTESQVIKSFRKSLIVNKYTIQMGKMIVNMATFLYYSGHMILLLIILTLIDVLFKLEITLWGQKVTTLHMFLLSYSLIIPMSFLMILLHYIFLKTRLK